MEDVDSGPSPGISLVQPQLLQTFVSEPADRSLLFSLANVFKKEKIQYNNNFINSYLPSPFLGVDIYYKI